MNPLPEVEIPSPQPIELYQKGHGKSTIEHRIARVQIRRDLGLQVKPEAEQLDGRCFRFRFGWVIDEDGRYIDEEAWILIDGPDDGPIWIASGDLVFDAN